MKTFKNFILEAKKCPEGKYYCYTDKKCKKIPTGYKIRYGGYLRSDPEENGKKNGKNGNGNGNGNGSNGVSNGGNGGNGGGNGGGGE